MDMQYLKNKYRLFRRSYFVRNCLQSLFRFIYPIYMKVFWWPISYCFRRFLPSPNKNGWEKRILIIKDDGIGDMVMSSGIIKHLKNYFPDRKIYILVTEGLEPVLKNCADEIFSFNPVHYFWKTSYRWHFLKKLRNIGFSVVVDGVLRRSDIDNDIAISLGARDTIAYEGEAIELESLQTLNSKFQNKFSKFIRTMDRKRGIGDLLAKATDHEKYFYSKAFDISIDDISPWIYSGSHRSEVSSYETLSRWNLTKHGYFTIGVGARATGRVWPSRRFREIASWVFSTTGLIPVLIGGKGEEALGFDLLNDNGRVINLIGKLSLDESFTVLQNAAFFIGNESGPMHLSTAFHVPVVVLFGGGHFGRCFPYGDHNIIIHYKMDCYLCGWHCHYRNLSLEVAPCIENITTDYVKSKLIEFYKINKNLIVFYGLAKGLQS